MSTGTPPPPGPAATTDVVLIRDDRVLLVARRYKPLGWALPGGFVDPGEKVEHAAVREVKEETGLDCTLSHLLNVYSDPARDRRRHTLSVVYIGAVVGDPTPIAGDDAGAAVWHPLHALPSPIAFDHAQILADAVQFLNSGERPIERAATPA
jgi:8-oxo-dGTP diphosphatase